MSGVFISYRHDGAEALAHSIYKDLTTLGYQVFYDTESLKSESFPERLYREIETCDDFVLILPKGGLDERPNQKNDWVRLEIAHALKCKKNIIPIMMRDFEFPEYLPEEIDAVRYCNGVPFETMEFYSARIEMLCEFLISKPEGDKGDKGGKKPTLIERIAKWIAKWIAIFFRAVWSGISFVCSLLWRFKPLRYAVLFFLGFMVLCYGIEVSRDIQNINTDQWIKPNYLFYNNPYMLNSPISQDNTLTAVYNGDIVTLYQIDGNKDPKEPVGYLQTDFKDTPVMIGFTTDKKFCFVIAGNQIEVFSILSGEKIKTGVFAFPNEEGSYQAVIIEGNKDFSYWMFFWQDMENDERLICSFYGEDFSLQQSIDMRGYRYQGSAVNGKYYIFYNTDLEFRVIDLENQCLVEDPRAVLSKECCGNIDDSFDRSSYCDETGRYLACYINGFLIIIDIETGDPLFSRAYLDLNYFAFDQNNTFVVLYGKKSENESITKQFVRIPFLESDPTEEVLLTHNELVNMLGDAVLDTQHQGVCLLKDTHFALFACDNRLHLIDLKEKRKTASSNFLINDQDTWEWCNIYPSGKHILTFIQSIFFVQEDLQTTQATLLRFSVEKKDGNVRVIEDSYQDDVQPNNLVMLSIGLLGLILFVCAGRSPEKNPKAVPEQK